MGDLGEMTCTATYIWISLVGEKGRQHGKDLSVDDIHECMKRRLPTVIYIGIHIIYFRTTCWILIISRYRRPLAT